MRRTNEPKWVLDAQGSLLGLAMGSDFCAEHEFGTKKLRASFGLPGDEVDGVERRRVRTCPPNLCFIDGKDKTILGYSPDTLSASETTNASFERRVREGELTRPGPWYNEDRRNLACAWDERSFGMVAWGKKADFDRNRVREMHLAFQQRDVAFWTNIGPFHIGGGLLFAIVSKLPKDSVDAMLAADLDQKSLLQAAANTGIETKLNKAGRRWFSLSPRWTKDSTVQKDMTAHPVVFWLNPMEQHLYNYGLYTVEQLHLWASNLGPILKSTGRGRQ
jgi:hypothetical protein